VSVWILVPYDPRWLQFGFAKGGKPAVKVNPNCSHLLGFIVFLVTGIVIFVTIIMSDSLRLTYHDRTDHTLEKSRQTFRIFPHTHTHPTLLIILIFYSDQFLLHGNVKLHEFRFTTRVGIEYFKG